MYRLLAWLGLCALCSAASALWWPVALIPAVVVVVLSAAVLSHRGSDDGTG